MRASPFWRRWEASIATQSAADLWHQAGKLAAGGQHQLLFARVQEDTSLEASFARGANAVCIASGGETAFDLLLGGARDVVAIDINPAQVLLVHLKAALFRSLTDSEINSAFLSDGRPAYDKLKDRLPAEVTQYFDSQRNGLSKGLANGGRIDRALGRGAKILKSFVVPGQRIERLLNSPSLEEQATEYRRLAGSFRARLALRAGFHPFVLKRMFGSRLGGPAPPGYGEKVRQDFEAVFTTVPAWDNPYLWQSLLGRYPESGMPGWLTAFGHSRMRQVISRLGLETGEVGTWLATREEPTLDLVCLSNVTDTAGESEKRQLVESFEPSVKRGGRVIARSLFNDPIGLDLLSGGRLKREPIDGWVDRSLICRNVEVYRWSPR